MLDEDTIALEARLIAIEYLLNYLANAIYLGHGIGRPVPVGIVELAHEYIRRGLRARTFHNSPADPVLKEHFVALILENVDRLLKEFEHDLAVAPGRKKQR
jgi:hypothetical protein